jgi:hypothetical protein
VITACRPALRSVVRACRRSSFSAHLFDHGEKGGAGKMVFFLANLYPKEDCRDMRRTEVISIYCKMAHFDTLNWVGWQAWERRMGPFLKSEITWFKAVFINHSGACAAG